MPGGKTIAHGYFTLSLVPQLSHDHQIDGARTASTMAATGCASPPRSRRGSRVARYKLINTEDVKNDGLRMTGEVTMELEGSERPACVAEVMSVVYPEKG